jgi:adenine-specific DNA-methyltransferase
VDFERLRAALGDALDDAPERYSFTWAGRRAALEALRAPSRATLVPCPEESLDWDTTRHVFIEGENLEALKLLLRPYHGRVKMIYIDPPYNTGNDFIYPDNFRDPLDTYLRLTGQKDAEGNLLTTNPETSGRYHSAWLTMMYPRLFLARQLLREDGVIFISIDDHEVHNLRMIMSELFGEENFVVAVAWRKALGANDTSFAYVHETLLLYRRSEAAQIGRLPRSEQQVKQYTNPDNDPRGPWASADYSSKYTPEERPTLHYPIVNPFTGAQVWPKKGQTWRFSRAVHELNQEDGRIWWGLEGELAVPRYKRFLSEVADGVVPRSLWDDVGTNEHGRAELNALVLA